MSSRKCDNRCGAESCKPVSVKPICNHGVVEDLGNGFRCCMLCRLELPRWSPVGVQTPNSTPETNWRQAYVKALERVKKLEDDLMQWRTTALSVESRANAIRRDHAINHAKFVQIENAVQEFLEKGVVVAKSTENAVVVPARIDMEYLNKLKKLFPKV